MPNTRDRIAKALEARSPFTIDGTEFHLELTGFEEPLPYQMQQIHIYFAALSTTNRQNAELHLAVDGYSDDEIGDLAVRTIRDIAAGKLPPGTNNLV